MFLEKEVPVIPELLKHSSFLRRHYPDQVYTGIFSEREQGRFLPYSFL
jgi:hypothetical protein